MNTTIFPNLCLAALVSLLSLGTVSAKTATYYFYGKAEGGGTLLFSDPSNWRPETVPPSDYSAQVSFAAQKSVLCLIDENDPWKLGLLVVATGVGPVTIEGNTLAFQNLEGGSKVFLACGGAAGEQTIATDILLEGNGEENTDFKFGGGEILLTGNLTATGSSAQLSTTAFPDQIATIRGMIDDKTDAGLSLVMHAGRLVLESTQNNFRGSVTIGVEDDAELVATTVADAGIASSIGSGPLIRFGLGYGQEDSRFALTVSGPGPQSSNREIEIVCNIDAAIPCRAVLVSEVSGEGVTFGGDLSLTRYNGDAFIVLEGSGNGTLSGIIPPRIMGLQKRGSGTWTITNPANELNGEVVIENGELRLRGGTGNPLGGANVVCSGKGILTGEGTLQGSLRVADGGKYLAEGGSLSVLGVVRFDAGSVFEFVPGAKGRIEAGEDVTISDAALIVRAGAASGPPGGEVILIKSDKPVDGTFQGLPEGAPVRVGNANAVISYKRGVVLKLP